MGGFLHRRKLLCYYKSMLQGICHKKVFCGFLMYSDARTIILSQH